MDKLVMHDYSMPRSISESRTPPCLPALSNGLTMVTGDHGKGNLIFEIGLLILGIFLPRRSHS
jgi:hypothetical protein